MKSLKVFITIVLLLCDRITFSKAALFFPSNSAYGLFAAIAVPLDLPHRNVFVSYNFEANYNLPETWGIPPYALSSVIYSRLELKAKKFKQYHQPHNNRDIEMSTGVEDEDLFEDTARLNNDKNCNNCTTSASTEESSETSRGDDADYEDTATVTPFGNETDASNSSSKRKRRRKREVTSLLTRTNFYHILIDKFKRSGFKGEPCLLRLICDTNASELGEINGVLGNLIHIMFSPTTSKDENLPLRYYQAEVDGLHDQCHHYEEQCPESILDLISTPLHKIIEQMEMNVKKFG